MKVYFLHGRFSFDFGYQGSADALTGAELARLCYEKYGLYHDMAIKCDRMQLVSDKKLVKPSCRFHAVSNAVNSHRNNLFAGEHAYLDLHACSISPE